MGGLFFMAIDGVNLYQMSQDELIRMLEHANEEKEKLEKDNKRLCIKKITNLNDGKELHLLSNGEIEQKIKERLPTQTYDTISATRTKHPFNGIECDAVKIELKREITGSIIINTPTAFFSTLFKADSIYARTIGEEGIKEYLLNSTELQDEGAIKGIKQDIVAAYHQYKIITILVPFVLYEGENDVHSPNADIKITSGSRIISLSVQAGKKTRNKLGCNII